MRLKGESSSAATATSESLDENDDEEDGEEEAVYKRAKFHPSTSKWVLLFRFFFFKNVVLVLPFRCELNFCFFIDLAVTLIS